ncbi:MAG: XRE family transcriptional regulator [Hyphomicrobiaceae bacterium]
MYDSRNWRQTVTVLAGWRVFGNGAAMSHDVGAKIRRLRMALGESQALFGDRFSVEQPTVSRWEKGEEVQRKHRSQLAELAGLSVAEFFHSAEQPRVIPVVGYVAGGERFIPVVQGEAGNGFDHVTLSIDPDDNIAVRVRGDSMSPVYRDGEVIVGRRLEGSDVSRAVGLDCIAMTTGGEGYVKRILKGAAPGSYRLRSYNPSYEDIEDVALAWAAPIWMIMRQR